MGSIDFQIKLLGALSVGDVRTGTIPSLLPSQKHYLKVYKYSSTQMGIQNGFVTRDANRRGFLTPHRMDVSVGGRPWKGPPIRLKRAI
ncbi:MAG: hypothetical protein V1736_03370 [Pseudomonadota bacterium]